MINNISPSIYTFLPECLWAFTALGLGIKILFQDKKIFKNLQGIETAWLVFVVLISLYLLNDCKEEILIFNNRWAISPLINLGKMTGLIVTFLLLKPLPHLKAHPYKLEYRFLMILAMIGLFCIMSANDLIILYLGIELQALSLYIILSIPTLEIPYKKISLKYFSLSITASVFLLGGISIIYGSLGGYTSFVEIGKAMIHPGIGLMVGISFVLAGLLFKLSTTPSHAWALNVYQRSTYAQISILEILPKLSILIILTRLIGSICHLSSHVLAIILVASFLSLLIGSLGGVLQNNLKRLLACSGIYHLGFLLLSLAIPDSNKASLILYLISYLPALFSILILFMSMTHEDLEIESINDLKGLSQRNPKIAFMLSIFLASLAGIPPCAGFWGKYYILSDALNKGLWTPYIVAILSMGIVTFYYLKILKVMYFEEEEIPITITLTGFSSMIIYLCLGSIIGFIFLQKWYAPYVLKLLSLGSI